MRKLILLTAGIALLFVPAAGCNSSAESSSTSTGSDDAALAAWFEKQSKGNEAADSRQNQNAAASASNTIANTSATNTTTARGNVPPPGSKRAGERPPVRSGGYVGAIARANRNIRTRLDDLPWKKSVQLFEAEMGHKPRDTKEFLERINRERTPLPDIPDGFTYLYLPDEGQFGELWQVPVEEMPDAERGTER